MKRDADRRGKIVEGYLRTITDDRRRLVCFLLMRGHDDREICRTLDIDEKSLEAVKLQIAVDLRQAGIRFGDDKC